MEGLDSGESSCGSGHAGANAGRRLPGLAAQAEVEEDLPRRERVRDRGDAMAAPATLGVSQHVRREGPTEELGPAMRPARAQGSPSPTSRCRGEPRGTAASRGGDERARTPRHAHRCCRGWGTKATSR